MKLLKHLHKLKKWGRNDAWLLIEIGHCYKGKDDREKALEFYLKAEKLDKNDIYLFIRYSLAL